MSAPHLLNAFLRTYLQDRAEGRVRSAAEYQQLFPGAEALIAEHHARYQTDAPEERVVPDLEAGSFRIGRFEVIKEIGRGGQGVVYFARDTELGRPVALKLLKGLSVASPAALHRLLREARITSRLHHPGICVVLEAQIEVGIPCIAMQWVEGITLARRIAATATAPDRVAIAKLLELVEQVARALHAAHEAGVVHRDIKPGNVMVTPQGDPVILDFGLAQGDDPDLLTVTGSGDTPGTPAYMSPEQLGRRGTRLDRRTDVWSLGVLLFEALTLERPFEAPTREALYRAILTEAPRDARTLNPAISKDLQVVLATALEKDPNRRYRTAAELADELRRVRLHQPIVARPVGPVARLQRWVRRSPALAAALFGIFAVLVAGLGVAISLLDQKQVALDDYDRLGDVLLLQRLQDDADGLWPCEEAKIPEMTAWLERARELAQRLDGHREVLARLRGAPPQERQSVPSQFKLTTTTKLVDELTELVDPDPRTGLVADVCARLEFARIVERETIERYRQGWAEAIRSISDPGQCPKYSGLVIRPQPGLIPIGRDPASGLWEFVHLQTAGAGSAPVPERAVDGRLQVTESMGVVLVLLPGGRFLMGTPARDEVPVPPGRQADVEAFHPREQPATLVTLDPFLMSKFEMTQAQWHRVVGSNPSLTRPPRYEEEPVDLRHPVEHVDWTECQLWLSRLGFMLPTEAQWEYAARGGTVTSRWTGDGTGGLVAAANVAEVSCRRIISLELTYETWDDGYATHAPVGTFAANPFGLHDVLGNVWEWCRDPLGPYQVAPRAGDGYRDDPSIRRRVIRGGSYYNAAEVARSAYREGALTQFCNPILGVRPAMCLAR